MKTELKAEVLDTPRPNQIGGGYFRLGLGIASLISIAVRLPFLRAPISGDEGGYAAAAYWWSKGAPLYSGPILDRPQLLAMVYRVAIWLTPASAVGIRLMAIVFGVFSTLLVGTIARRLFNSTGVGVATALVYSLVGSSPSIEAFSAYGELLAGVPTMVSILLFQTWSSSRERQNRSKQRVLRRNALIFGSGLFGASAILMKQSGFDGFATVFVLLCALLTFGEERITKFLRTSSEVPSRREAAEGLAIFGLGALSVGTIAAIHGADSGLSRYWNSVVGYRLNYLSATSTSGGNKLGLLFGNAGRIAPLLVPLTVLAIVGYWSASRRTRVLTLLWFAFSVAGFLAGGLYWLHYFIEPVLALCPLAGNGLFRLLSMAPKVRQRRNGARGNVQLGSFTKWPLGVPIVLLATALVLAQNAAAWNLASRRDGSERAIEIDHRYLPVAKYLKAHTSAWDTIQPLWQSGAVTFYAQRHPATPYMWATWFDAMPGAKELLVDRLTSSNGPKYVALIHELKIMPGYFPVETALVANYRLETIIAGSEIWRRKR